MRTIEPRRASPVRRRGVRLLAIIGAALAAGGCASAGAAPGGPGIAGVPGFDTRTYPGDAVMRQWRDGSPYRWVGYYLTAPCHPRSTWTGQRAALAAMDWGFAVLYVGEQDWSAVANPPAGPGLGASGAEPRCTSVNLTAGQGAADAQEASGLAAAEGFPAGTVIYLNVERVDAVSPALEAYVRGWVGAMLDGGDTRPGLYVHARNADALLAIGADAFARRDRADRPRLWVAKSGGFDLRATPRASGFPAATIWQGLFEVRQTWGGATLTIDANVADLVSPST